MAGQRDPRSIITPDAFELSMDLVGTPLAAPRRRAAALFIDAIVVGIITAVTQSFALILGVVAAAFFVRAGFKRTAVRGSVFGRAMRFSVGCLGLFIGLVTASIWAVVSLDSNSDSDPTSVGSTGIPGLDGVGLAGIPGLDGVGLTAAGASAVLEDAESLAEAEDLLVGMVELGDMVGLEPDGMRSVLLAAVPEDLGSPDELAAMIDRVLGIEESDGDRESREGFERGVEGYSTAEALRAYQDVLSADPEDEDAAGRRRALESRLAGTIARDTIAALQRAVSRLDDELEDEQDAREDLERALDDASSMSLLGRLRDLADEIGFGFSWAILYATVFLSWWNGQTVGKRMMGIRVVRLDGGPITWWIAFERAGGYAAGFATGLLGFAQVWWNANRQGIHDRIVGTVVVVEGAEKVADWESAL